MSARLTGAGFLSGVVRFCGAAGQEKSSAMAFAEPSEIATVINNCGPSEKQEYLAVLPIECELLKITNKDSLS
jgi:hypothetical protein